MMTLILKLTAGIGSTRWSEILRSRSFLARAWRRILKTRWTGLSVWWTVSRCNVYMKYDHRQMLLLGQEYLCWRRQFLLSSDTLYVWYCWELMFRGNIWARQIPFWTSISSFVLETSELAHALHDSFGHSRFTFLKLSWHHDTRVLSGQTIFCHQRHYSPP
jgi:hypothetical protein